MSRWLGRIGLVSGLAGLFCLFPGKTVNAETCLSPFVKRLDRPEKFLYVFCLDARAKAHDFLGVIDVDVDSSTYGQLVHWLDLGSSGNETYHFGFTDDRTHIWGAVCFPAGFF